MAVCFWYLVKRNLSSVRNCTVAYTSVTLHKVLEQHGHLYLVGLFKLQYRPYLYYPEVYLCCLCEKFLLIPGLLRHSLEKYLFTFGKTYKKQCCGSGSGYKKSDKIILKKNSCLTNIYNRLMYTKTNNFQENYI